MGGDSVSKQSSTRRLKDIVEFINGDRGKNYPSTGEFQPSGIPFIGTQHLANGAIDAAGLRYISQEKFDKLSGGKIRPYDLLYCLRGQSLGRVALVRGFDIGAIASSLVILRSQDPLDARYLYYVLSGPLGRRLAVELNNGSAQPNISATVLGQQIVPFPDARTRSGVALFLSAIDEKIELNRRMNETLEAIARAVFKSWFVDFDPVRAKLDGRQPPGMDAATAALFPDGFEDTEVGKVPRGWKVQKLEALTSEIGSGATPRGGAKVYVEEGIALVRSQNVFDYHFEWDGLARITDEDAAKLEGVALQERDILFNITGASILRTCIVDPRVLPARVNQHVARIRAKPGVSPWFLHEYLVHPQTKEHLLGFNAGATREAITKGHLQNLPIVTPPSEVMTAYDQKVEPLYLKKQQAASESQTLSALRDTLLPKLLSGEIRVGQAAEMVREG